MIKIRILTLFLLIFLCFSHKTFADTFTVINNADSGPGSLRQALADAATNGTAVRDNIVFNIPGTTADASTITLLSPINVSSNLIIDGTTQPGSPIIDNAGVMIVNSPGFAPATPIAPQSVQDNKALLILNKVANVEIDGLSFKIPQDTYGIFSYTFTSAIYIYSSQNINIGVPGKGNTFNAGVPGIYCDDKYDSPAVPNNNISIKSNNVGLNLSQWSLSGGSAIIINGDHSVIGGTTAAEGNFTVNGIIVNGNSNVVNHNFIGVDRSGTVLYPYNVYGLNSQSTLTGNDLQFLNNAFGVVSFNFNGVSNFVMQGNQQINDQLVSLSNEQLVVFTQCSNGLIGGDNDTEKNIFKYDAATLFSSSSTNIEVRKNSISCSDFPFQIVNGTNIPKITVLVNSATEYSGTADPNSDIYIYNDNTSCPVCNPVEFYTKITTGSDGTWKITGDFSNKTLVANATLIHSSSDYTRPLMPGNPSDYKLVNPTCIPNSGSITITGTLKNVINVIWYNNDTNQQIGTGINLSGLAPGKYYAIGYNGKCSSKTQVFELVDMAPSITDNALRVTGPTCGANNGGIRFLSPVNIQDYTPIIKWTNQSGAVVGSEIDLTHIGPGFYTLSLTDKVTGCKLTYGPVTVTKVPPPVINQLAAVITPTPCGQSTGSITNVKITGAVGTIRYSWIDQNDKVVATTADLLNEPAGKYYLSIYDDNNCTPVQSLPITIAETNTVTLDISGITQTICGHSGSITGIKAPGATKYQWFNDAGAVAANTIDLINAPAGGYYLLASNAYCSKQTSVYTITATPDISISGGTIAVDHCSGNQASIKDIHVFGGVAPYKYQWTDQNNKVIGTDINVFNLSAGVYTFKVTDNTICATGTTSYTITAQSDDTILASDISNTFTPNGDNVNDKWIIKGIENFPAALIQVFNRNGQIVYQCKGYSTPFDGTYHNAQLSTGTYYYIINLYNGCSLLSGSVTIIR